MRDKVSFMPERLKEALIAANMTTSELAVKVGVSTRSMRRYMSGAPIQKSEVRADIARTLNVNVIWLGGRDVQMERTPGQRHLDKLLSNCESLKKDDRLLKLASALVDAPEQERKEIAEMLGTPTDTEPIEVKVYKAKAK